MSPTLSLGEQLVMAGLTYGRRHDILYRAGLVIQVLGAAILAVLYPLDSPFYTIGIMIFEIGVLLSAIYLLVRMRSIKIIILVSVVAGLALQAAGVFAVSELYAGTTIIIGIGLVCVGAGGMVGKEAYCFGYREGWLLMLIVFPVVILANAVGKENRVFNSLGVFPSLSSLALSDRQEAQAASVIEMRDGWVRVTVSEQMI